MFPDLASFTSSEHFTPNICYQKNIQGQNVEFLITDDSDSLKYVVSYKVK
jgi:hypothetical protein